MDATGAPDGLILALPAEPDGWRLAPEGAAVLPSQGIAVVADVHLGYEWARAAGGDMVPPHSLAETLAKLERLRARIGFDRLIVAGDLTESSSPCLRTARDLAGLTRWLGDRGVTLDLVPGNHDPPRRPAPPATREVAGWTIGHGHRPIDGDRILFGHFHPVLKADGLTAPCFLVSERAVALPAFSPNAAGRTVTDGWTPDGLPAPAQIRCVAGLDGTLLDFGPLDRLVRRCQGLA